MEKQDFINAGYVAFNSNILSDYAECGLQKRVRDEDGNTKYFINVMMYDMSKINVNLSKKYSFEYEVRLFTGSFLSEDGHLSFAIKGCVESICEVEQHIENAYFVLNCIPDVHNN